MAQGRVYAAALMLPFTLTACGGGGGGGGGDTPIPQTPTATVKYSGLRTDATLTEENIGRFVGLIIGREELASPLFATAASAPQAKTRVHEPLLCDRGEGEVSGDINENTGLGTLTATFRSCASEGVILDGSYSVTFEKWNEAQTEPLDFVTSFSSFRTTLADGSYLQFDGVVVERGAFTCSSTSTTNLSVSSSIGAESYWLDNFRVATQCANDAGWGSNAERRTVSGSLYLADLGRVDISAQNAVFATQVYVPDAPGGLTELLADGTVTLSNSSGRLSLTGHTEPDDGFYGPDYTVQLVLDLGDDGSHERDLTVPSWFAATPRALDLGDDDGDGLWNGWERIYGLDPGRDDADEDADSDGFTNRSEFLAFSDPFDSLSHPIAALRASSDIPYDASLISGAEMATRISLRGLVDEAFSAQSASFDLRITLGEGADLFQFDSPFDCQLATEGVSVSILCTGIPTALFNSEQSEALLGTLRVVAVGEAHYRCVNFAMESALAIDFIGDGWCYQMLGEPGAASVQANSAAYVLDELIAPAVDYSFGLRMNGAANAPNYILQGRLIDNNANASLLRVETFRSAGACSSVVDNQFDCSGDLSALSEITMSFAKPPQQGTVTMVWDIRAEYTDTLVVTSRAQRTLAFGQSSRVLQALIDTAISDAAERVELPAGIFVGGVQVTQPLLLDGAAGTELWLVESQPEWYSDSPLSLQADQPITVQGMTLYMLNQGLRLNGGVVRDNQIHVIGNEAFQLIYSDAMDGASLTVDGNRIDYAEAQPHMGYGQPVIRSVVTSSCGYGSTDCPLQISNNWIRDNGSALTLVENDSFSHSAVAEPVPYDLVLVNNTLIDVDHLIVVRYPDNYPMLVANNVQFQRVRQQASEPVILGYGNDYATPEQVLDLRANLLMNSAPQQIELNYVVPASLTEAELTAPQATSPTVDTGIDLSLWLDRDLTGAMRPAGNGFDIGALEYQP